MAFAASSTETSGITSTPSDSLRFQTLDSGDEAICNWTPVSAADGALLPRRNVAYNASAGKGVDILLFGGEMADGMMADLWSVDCATMQTRLVKVEGEAPTARSGSRALLVGNAYIVFGGSSFNAAKKEDASLFLLNTITKTWSVARISKQKPSCRTGHSFSLIGSKVFVFGGQPSSMTGAYANDLWAFDINTLFAANAQWEQLTFEDTLSPCPRSNHSAVVHLGKLYIFGGTDGRQTFFDLWMFDPVRHSWTEIVAQGFIPASRHSHSAVVVSGMMFVFGGVDGAGSIMNDFAAFNISSSYWHQFDNSSCPAARFGHAMTTVRSKIYLLGGEVSYPSNSDSNVYVVDVATMKFPTEKSGFSTVHSLRARLASANLYNSNTSNDLLRHKRQESDSQSMRSVGSRSIRSIRTDLGRDITVALGSANAQEALERVLSKVQYKRAPTITAADIRELDQYCAPTSGSKKPVVGRSNSVLNYFKRRRGSYSHGKAPFEECLDKVATTRTPISSLSGPPQQTASNPVPLTLSLETPMLKKDIQPLDLQRFLSLEREIYKRNPGYMPVTDKELHPLPELAMPTTTKRDAQKTTATPDTLPISTKRTLAPALARTTSSTSRVDSVAASSKTLDKDAQSILKRFGLAGTETWSSKRGKRKNIASTNSDDTARNIPVVEDTIERRVGNIGDLSSKGNEIDSKVLLNALLVLRQELSNQKRFLTAERNLARQDATEATTRANKLAQDKLNCLRKADEKEALVLRQQAENLAIEETKLKGQVQFARSERDSMANEIAGVRTELLHSTQALKTAEEALKRYVTIEAEAEELSLRQASQTQIIEQVTAHIGTYQLRATEAEMKVEAETYRCNEAEKEILALRSQLSELQLQLKHVHRLSSLAKYNWQTSAEEAETSRNVMIAGLKQLLEAKDAHFVKVSRVASPLPEMEKPVISGINVGAETQDTNLSVNGDRSSLDDEEAVETKRSVNLPEVRHAPVPRTLDSAMQSVLVA